MNTLLLGMAVLSMALAAWPALMFLRNLLHYRPLPRAAESAGGLAISVLIPARNEAHTIGAAVEAVLANDHPLELIVLDDHSTDGTGGIVGRYAQGHPQVRLEQAPALPPGWCGKQHACLTLAGLAKNPLLLFLDADVRLAPDALRRLAAYADRHGDIPLASGFPRQVTRSLVEELLIPLMHFILLGFLPLHRMRRSASPAYAAGCGQLFLARAAAYRAIGGHGLVKSSLHDGITLPRAFRNRGERTDLFDATDLASCRMYTSPGAVWEGLAKNATEGLAAPAMIVPVTVVLMIGHVFPFGVVLLHQVWPLPPEVVIAAGIAVSFAWTPRLYAMIRFRQGALGALLHPVGILLLLLIQWYALVRKLRGRPATWKDRSYSPVI